MPDPAEIIWYRNTVNRQITEQLDLQAHASRYAYACDLLELYQADGFSKGEADATRWILGTGMEGGAMCGRCMGDAHNGPLLVRNR